MEQIKRYHKSELLGNTVYGQIVTPNHSCDIHWHEFYEITYYPYAFGSTVVNNQTSPVTPGTIILLTPLDFHSSNLDFPPETTCFKIYFLDDDFEPEFTRFFNEPILLHDISPDSFLHTLFLELCTSRNSSDPWTKSIQSNLLKLLLLKIIQQNTLSPTTSLPPPHPLVRRAIRYIADHFEEDPSLHEVANHLSISPTYFSRQFHQTTNMTFQSYLTTFKLKYAEHLLRESDFSVTEIALRCGFHNLSNFLRCFKNHHHVTPKQYRDLSFSTSSHDFSGKKPNPR